MPQSTEMKKHILKKYLICKKTIAINWKGYIILVYRGKRRSMWMCKQVYWIKLVRVRPSKVSLHHITWSGYLHLAERLKKTLIKGFERCITCFLFCSDFRVIRVYISCFRHILFTALTNAHKKRWWFRFKLEKYNHRFSLEKKILKY